MTRELLPPLYHPIDFWEHECDMRSLRKSWKLIKVVGNAGISSLTFQTPNGSKYEEINDAKGNTISLINLGR